MNQSEETNQTVLVDAVNRLMNMVSWETLQQMMIEAATLAEDGSYSIGIKELKRIFEGYDSTFPTDILIKKQDKHIVRKVDLQDVFDTIVGVLESSRAQNVSHLDTLKLIMIEEDNDLNSYSLTLQQFIRDEEYADIKQGFADSIVKCTEEDLMRLIGDVVSLGVERGRLNYVPLTIKFIRYFAEYGMEQETFFERYLVCNGYVDKDALHELLMQFAEVTPTELLDNLIRHDINGSAVFGLNRLSDHLYGKIGKEVIRKYLEVATESGKQEIAMVVRDMLRKKMVSEQPQTALEDLSQYRKQETEVLKEYSQLLAYMDDVRRPVSGQELEHHLGKYIDVSGIATADLDMRSIRALEAWSFLENSEVLRKLYGPVNPPNYIVEAEDMEIDVPYDPRLFHMRFNDIAYRLNQMDGCVDEELLDDPFLAFNRDWFSGYCQYSNDVILHRDQAFRKPRNRGGWYGCYGSPDSILLEILQSYDVPAAKRQAVLDNIQEQFVRFFREVLGLEDNKLGYAYMTKNRTMLLSDEEDPQTNDDIDSPINRLPKIVIKYAVEHDEPSYREDSDMQAFAQKILDGILAPGDSAMDLVRDGGPTRKFEKEVILKREDILVFALTKIYFAY